MTHRPSYPAKVLLFGEHVVLRGATALAVPYEAFNLRWQKSDNADERLLDLGSYLEENTFTEWLRIPDLNRELRAGWQLVGNVPQGYGLGSSGTVCAAVWDRYATPAARKLALPDLRPLLAKMEAFYHGTSSGTDPLIAYVNRAVRLSRQPPEIVELPGDWQHGLFLLDTRRPRQSSRLIDTFLQRYDSDEAWRNQLLEKWVPASEGCIAALLKADRFAFQQHFSTVSSEQYRLVPDFIPESIRPLWQGNGYSLKLCGAGGGGFMLGYSEDWKIARKELEEWTLYTL